ncbi:MAG: biopolymer transporter ExbB, partial [Desulfobacterales bacterium]|nr:biopolymer transporter ExbB [Desulfobacterales bacterium]
MKKVLFTLLISICFISSVHAEDMRKAAVEARKELALSLERDRESRQAIARDRAAITRTIEGIDAENRQLKERIEIINQRITDLSGQNKEMVDQAAQDQTELDELSGAVRVAAGNLKAILTASMYTAADPGRIDRLAPILDTSRFPGIDDMAALSTLFLEESTFTGGIELKNMPFVSDTGETVQGEVLILGGFTAAYRLGETTGFLNYSPESKRLYALSALPSRHIRKNINQYMGGMSDSVA